MRKRVTKRIFTNLDPNGKRIEDLLGMLLKYPWKAKLYHSRPKNAYPQNEKDDSKSEKELEISLHESIYFLQPNEIHDKSSKNLKSSNIFRRNVQLFLWEKNIIDPFRNTFRRKTYNID